MVYVYVFVSVVKLPEITISMQVVNKCTYIPIYPSI